MAVGQNQRDAAGNKVCTNCSCLATAGQAPRNMKRTNEAFTHSMRRSPNLLSSEQSKPISKISNLGTSVSVIFRVGTF